MDDTKKFNEGMEGEGNKTADKHYRDAASEHAKSGKVEQEARDAERALDDDREELDHAAQEGKRHSKGDLDSDLKKKS